jgi:hypothetical protein
LDIGTICKRDYHGVEVLWDTMALHEWLSDISTTWKLVYLLMHLLAFPARGSEEEMWQHANDCESPRHLFLSQNLGTLVTKSNYNKGSTLTGIYKVIIRVIPYELAEIITILLRVVRPVELMAVLKFQSGTAERTKQIVDHYQQRLFVTLGEPWTSDHMSSILQTWFQDQLQVPFGMRLHRHFAQALQRKYFAYKDASPLAEAANLAFGHTQETADMHYAREAGNLAVPETLQHKFEKVGSEWIDWHGIKVSPGKKE